MELATIEAMWRIFINSTRPLVNEFLQEIGIEEIDDLKPYSCIPKDVFEEKVYPSIKERQIDIAALAIKLLPMIRR